MTEQKLNKLEQQNIELDRFALYIESHDEQFKYMLLDRLRMDCKYYLGSGNGSEHCLWGETVEMHIKYMYIIYDSLKIKPEWLTKHQIKVYSDLMLYIKNDKNF